MRPPSPCGAESTICIGQSINTASLSTLCCARIAGWRLRKRSSGAVATHSPGWPRKVNLDGNAASHRGLRLLRREDPRWQSVVVRSRRYLNNIVEQDHRAIKRRCVSMLGFKSFRTAAITLGGIELAHRIRKRQYSFDCGRQCRFSSLKQLWDRALA